MNDNSNKLGNYDLNKIYNEDCYQAIKNIPDKSIDLIVTDPPYEWQKGGEMTGLFRKGVSSRNFMYQIEQANLDKGIDYSILDEWVRVMKKINIYIWCNKDQIYRYMKYFVGEKKCNFEIIIWKKTNVTPLCGNKYLTDKEYCLFFREKGVQILGKYETKNTVYISSLNKEDKDMFEHPNCKPLEIIKNVIINSSIEGGVILDTFIGSGTTAVACKELNRNFIGFELDKKYYEIACNRLKGLTQQDVKIQKEGQMTLFDEV